MGGHEQRTTKMKSALKINIKKEAKKEMAKPAEVAAEATPMEEPGESKEFEKYELEDAVNTLQKAMEIKHNEALMKAIEPMLERKKKAITSIDDLRAVAKEKGVVTRMED
jgi:hypothetical protein